MMTNKKKATKEKQSIFDEMKISRMSATKVLAFVKKQEKEKLATCRWIITDNGKTRILRKINKNN
jgi:hypothetical protein